MAGEAIATILLADKQHTSLVYAVRACIVRYTTSCLSILKEPVAPKKHQLSNITGYLRTHLFGAEKPLQGFLARKTGLTSTLCPPYTLSSLYYMTILRSHVKLPELQCCFYDGIARAPAGGNSPPCVDSAENRVFRQNGSPEMIHISKAISSEQFMRIYTRP